MAFFIKNEISIGIWLLSDELNRRQMSYQERKMVYQRLKIELKTWQTDYHEDR